MNLVSQNGWQVILDGTESRICRWRVPLRHGVLVIPLRRGSVGFLLCHFIIWWDERVEPVHQRLLDDWGWAPLRNVRGAVDAISNHSSGTAVDINATQHVLGKAGTVKGFRARILRATRRFVYSGCLTWGGVWRRPDEMHVEITDGKVMRDCERAARRLMNTPQGRRLLEANPGQKAVILS